MFDYFLGLPHIYMYVYVCAIGEFAHSQNTEIA